jgi:hypothetical protein
MPNYQVRHQCDGPRGKTCGECKCFAIDEHTGKGAVYIDEYCSGNHRIFLTANSEACKEFKEK